MSRLSNVCAITVFGLAGHAYADTLSCAVSGAAFARGYCAVVHVTDPEGWVRGIAHVNNETGLVDMKLGLETDSTTKGPCGQMQVYLRDADGRDLAKIVTDRKQCIPGKSPGGARIVDLPVQRTVPVAVAKATKSILVTVELDGTSTNLWGINFADRDPVSMAVTIINPSP